MKKKLIKLTSILILILLFLFTQNNWISTSRIDYQNDKIPKAFNDSTILHISDLHNKEFLKDNKYLIKKVKQLNPDYIFITGDIIDASKTNIQVAVIFAKAMSEIAPTYYVSGNHEVNAGRYSEVISKLEKVNVTIMDNQGNQLTKENQTINIYGLSDPINQNFSTDIFKDINTDDFNILLSHRPELFDIYSQHKLDLTFSGHAHGGQFRIPFIGGLVAPNQGFFPKLTQGLHTQEDSSLIISRGLGNSIIPIRLLNRPELILTTLKSK